MIEESLRVDDLWLAELRKRLRVKEIPMEEVAEVDPGFRSSRSINSPREYQNLTKIDA